MKRKQKRREEEAKNEQCTNLYGHFVVVGKKYLSNFIVFVVVFVVIVQSLWWHFLDDNNVCGHN